MSPNDLRHKARDATLEVSVGASPSLNQTCDTLVEMAGRLTENLILTNVSSTEKPFTPRWPAQV